LATFDRRVGPALGRSTLSTRRSGRAGCDPSVPFLPETMSGSPLPPRPAALGSHLAFGSSPLCPPRWTTDTPHYRTHVPPKRLRLSDNSIRAGAAIPCNSVVVSALRHKNALSLGSPSKNIKHRGRPGGSELPGHLAAGCGCRAWSWHDRWARAVAEWCGCRCRVGAGEWQKNGERCGR
jgi:hypothetical protein